MTRVHADPDGGLIRFRRALGDGDTLMASLKAASETIPETHAGRAKITPAKWFSFLFIPLSVAMFPHIFQHWLTAKSAASFKLPVVAHPIFIMIVWVPCVLIGVWATGAGLGDDVKPNQVLATLVHQHSGELLGGLLTAGILAAIMSSLDSQFLCVGSLFTNDIVAEWDGTLNNDVTDTNFNMTMKSDSDHLFFGFGKCIHHV